MSYIVTYKRDSSERNLDGNVKICTEIVSNQQYKRIKKIPWIKIMQAKRCDKPVACNSLK